MYDVFRRMQDKQEVQEKMKSIPQWAWIRGEYGMSNKFAHVIALICRLWLLFT